MFRIERMHMTVAILSPQMVIVDFGSRGTVSGVFSGEHLSADGSVVRHHFWRLHPWLKFGRTDGAIMLPHHEIGYELVEQPLFQSVAQPVVVGIDRGLRYLIRLLSPERRQRQNQAGSPKVTRPFASGSNGHAGLPLRTTLGYRLAQKHFGFDKRRNRSRLDCSGTGCVALGEIAKLRIYLLIECGMLSSGKTQLLKHSVCTNVLSIYPHQDLQFNRDSNFWSYGFRTGEG